MFDIGFQELILIFVIALLVFGPKNLPQLGRSLGRAMREFKRASDEFRNTIETNLHINEPDLPPTLQPVSSATPATEGASAGATPTEPLPDSVLDPYGALPAGEAGEESGEPYVAQRAGRLFHDRKCQWARKVAEPERIYFKRVAEAKEAGFVGCPVCDPWEPA